MTKSNDGLFGGNGGSWFIILILFFLGMGGGLFGGNRTDGLSKSDLYEGLGTQDIQSGIGNLGTSLNNGFNGIQIGMNNGFANNTMAMNNGFNGVNSNLANLGYQMSQCCCEMKQSIQTQGDLTRSLINQNTMQEIRDKLAEKDRELLFANFSASQVSQTNAIEQYILANKATSTTTA